ncbi:G1/S-specific cyclin pas1 [Naviculisporaceae sp. PSN 640]
MKCDDYTSLGFIKPTHNAPYIYSSLASTASTSTTSVCTAASDSDSPNSSNASDSCESYCFSHPSNSQSSVSSIGSLCEPPIKLADPWQKQPIQQARVEPAPELRQNPRRTSSSAVSRIGRPPTLVRQDERKVNFVDNLVDSSTHIVETIWPTSSIVPRNECGKNKVLPLRLFIQETLRRSKTSYSTLQVALYYLILVKPHVPACDFTMEQPDDCHTSQMLQCGRRMFLAALILASKYLQDRNYSAKAWSKISGLGLRELNQNEMAFLLAVNFKLHVTVEKYNRWTEGVMRHTPSQPPSPGGPAQQLIYERQCEEFRYVIMNLRPELDNLEEICPWTVGQGRAADSLFFGPPSERPGLAFEGELVSTPRFLEPSLTTKPQERQLPALGLLPTPRLTPQSSGFSTPAAGAGSCLRGSSMGYAMTQASYAAGAHCIVRPSPSISSSPQCYFTRRSSLANSVSTASSPESMVSDSSRISRSSSISSASSLANAPAPSLDVQARYRYARQCSSERWGLRPTIASVPEGFEENCLTASPEMFGMVNKAPIEIPVPFLGRQPEIAEAARALQDLQRYGANQTAQVKTGTKRGRSISITNENSLQGNVREILMNGFNGSEPAWADTLVLRTRPETFGQSLQRIPVPPVVEGRNKRLRCSPEADQPYIVSSLHPAVGGMGGPGMWEGILN